MLMGSPHWISDMATSLVLVKPTGSSSSPGRRSARLTPKAQLGTSILRPLEELHPSCLRKATVKQVDTIFIESTVGHIRPPTSGGGGLHPSCLTKATSIVL